jgi:predicted TIM-barrel fold metal-dependent hydrolase
MLPRLKCPVIALEEHYWDMELAAQFVGGEGVRDPEMLKRLHDLGEVRIKEMDEAGIDMQVLSHGAPSAQKLSGADAVDLTRRVNDRLHAVVTGNPKRFAAFAAHELRGQFLVPVVLFQRDDRTFQPWQHDAFSPAGWMDDAS